MSTNDVLDDIIAKLDVKDVPVEYIVMAKVTDQHGRERILKGEELESLLDETDDFDIVEARIILNVRKIRSAIVDAVNELYDEVNDAIRRTG